jgi:hypothetical protein
MADYSFSGPLSHLVLFAKLSLKICPFMCPVSSPTIHSRWALYSFYSSFVLLTEGSVYEYLYLFEST